MSDTSKTKQVKYKDSKTGTIKTLTQHSNGRLTYNGNPVTPNEDQKPYDPGTRKEKPKPKAKSSSNDGPSFTKRIKAKRAAKKAKREAGEAGGEGKKRGLFGGVKNAAKSAGKAAKSDAKATKAAKAAKVKDAAKSASLEQLDGMSMKTDGASVRFLGVGKRTKGQERRGLKRANNRKYGKGESGKSKKAAHIQREFAEGSMDMMGASMPGMISMYKKFGASMNASQDKSASMDDYSHEKKLKSDGRYEAAHGKMANAKNDFDHAHALKKDAKHDAKGRHSIMKHMKGFK